MEDTIFDLFSRLTDKDNNTACAAMQTLQSESEKSNCVYPYLDSLADMLENKNSYIRNRSLILIAYNAKWDTENKINKIIDRFLCHINDIKPITSRQCIKMLPLIAMSKPELKDIIVSSLKHAGCGLYADSMQPLVDKDIECALQQINNM